MLVHCKVSTPIKVNGKWTTVIKEVDEEFPAEGRHSMICNRCGNKEYPECRKVCPIELGRIEQEQKEAARKAADRKAEFELLVGLIEDGFLQVEDAAPRIGMTAEEFKLAMDGRK